MDHCVFPRANWEARWWNCGFVWVTFCNRINESKYSGNGDAR